MPNLKLRSSREIGVRAFSLKNFETKGLAYSVITSPENSPVGGQCAYCNTVIWTNSRKNSILSKPPPLEASGGGEIYREYYRNNLTKFLDSLPACPRCHKKLHDLFINNLVISRFEDGSEYNFDLSMSEEEHIYSYPDVWWYEESSS